MPIYTLYHDLGSTSAAPQAMLSMIGAPYRLERVPLYTPLHRTPAYLAVNPLGTVPSLLLPDGETVTESAAILLLLGERHPEAGLVPVPGSPDRPRFLRWLTYLSATVYPPTRRYYHLADHVAGAAAQAELRRTTVVEQTRLWAAMEAAFEPAPYLLGDRPSALDLAMAMIARLGAPESGFDTACPRLAAARDAIEAHPEVAPVWRENFPDAA
jgi:GST-like protein